MQLVVKNCMSSSLNYVKEIRMTCQSKKKKKMPFSFFWRGLTIYQKISDTFDWWMLKTALWCTGTCLKIVAIVAMDTAWNQEKKRVFKVCTPHNQMPSLAKSWFFCTLLCSMTFKRVKTGFMCRKEVKHFNLRWIKWTSWQVLSLLELFYLCASVVKCTQEKIK